MMLKHRWACIHFSKALKYQLTSTNCKKKKRVSIDHGKSNPRNLGLPMENLTAGSF